MAVYEIDLIRALFEDKLNDPSIFLASFYEQIQEPDEIDRYLDSIKELINLQNRTTDVSGYKAMGIVSQSDEAEIVNIKNNFVVPMGYQVRVDIDLQDRDYVLDKIKTLINNLRGRKFDIAILPNGEYVVFNEPQNDPFTYDLPTIFNKAFFTFSGGNPLTTPSIFFTSVRNNFILRKSSKDINFNLYFIYQGNLYSTIYKYNDWTSSSVTITEYNASPEKVNVSIPVVTGTLGEAALQTAINNFLDNANRTNRGVLRVTETSTGTMFYYGVSIGTETRTTPISLGVPQFFKLSLSFNGVQSQEPYLSNGDDRVFLFFGGNATITDHRVTLGNDIILTTLQEGKNTGTITRVEPTEVPASLAIDDDSFSTWSMGHRTIDRNMKIGNRLSYTFVYDNSIPLYNNLYRYARFGAGASTFANLIFTIKEYRYSFGVLTTDTYYAKINEASTQNTNGDVMMIMLAMKVGDY